MNEIENNMEHQMQSLKLERQAFKETIDLI